VVLLVRVPDVPVTVAVNVPVAAELDAVRVRPLLDVAGFVPNVAVTPLGTPDALKVTLLLNPFAGLIVMVVEPNDPCRIVKVVGAADSVKLGCGPDDGQLFTKFAALTVPMPVAKSHPTFVPYAGTNEVLEVESTPIVPSAR
jgi:hypothetical protein